MTGLLQEVLFLESGWVGLLVSVGSEGGSGSGSGNGEFRRLTILGHIGSGNRFKYTI